MLGGAQIREEGGHRRHVTGSLGDLALLGDTVFEPCRAILESIEFPRRPLRIARLAGLDPIGDLRDPSLDLCESCLTALAGESLAGSTKNVAADAMTSAIPSFPVAWMCKRRASVHSHNTNQHGQACHSYPQFQSIPSRLPASDVLKHGLRA